MMCSVVRGICFINQLQKKKYISSIFIFCLISCVIIITKWSPTTANHPTLASASQENVFYYFHNFRKTTNSSKLDNLTNFTKYSSQRCFILWEKNKPPPEANSFTKNNDLVTRAVDRENQNKTNNEKLLGQTNTNKESIERKRTCNRFVILGGTMGRTGNQMFEVAAVIGMAMKHDMIPIIHENIQLGEYFNLPNQDDKIRSNMSNVRGCICNKASFYYNCANEFKSGANVSMHGYLQSWKYFVHAEFVIRSIFKAKDAYLSKATEYIRSIYLKGHQLVCLHIRRGDMTTQAAFKFGYVLPNMTFIEKAKRFYTNKYDKVQFLVVCEDKPWCREHFRGIHISPFTDPGVELALLMSCNHVIVTGGSYGWWGAWLAGGSVVYFNGHLRPNSSLELETNRPDYYPPSWIGMSQNPE